MSLRIDGTITSFRGDQKHLYCFVMERPSLFGDIITSALAVTQGVTQVETQVVTELDTQIETQGS